jgi:PAS domain S-box-containing protein
MMQNTESEVEVVQLRGQVDALQQLLEVQERVVQHQSEKLQQSEARFRALSNSAPIGILRVDTGGLCLYANPCAEQLCRGALPSLPGSVWLDVAFPQDRPAVERGFRSAVDGLTPPPTEFRVRRDGDAPGWVSARATRFQAADQQTEGLVITLEDITARKEAEAELEKLHRSLAETSRKAGMAEVASGMLHNIGNVLNSLNVSISMLEQALQKSRTSAMGKLADMLEARKADLVQFLTTDPQGSLVPEYIVVVARHLAAERSSLLSELTTITKSVEHIKRIVSVQQSYTGVWRVSEKLRLEDLLEDALHLSVHSFDRHRITVVREYDDLPVIETDKHKVLQILLNLISNASDALRAGSTPDRQLRVRLSARDGRVARIEMFDNGVGIRAEDLVRIFTLGFTTKKEGHGLGLHGSAIAAKQLGGSLTVRSEGPQCGAVFALDLPFDPPHPIQEENSNADRQ